MDYIINMVHFEGALLKKYGWIKNLKKVDLIESIFWGK